MQQQSVQYSMNVQPYMPNPQFEESDIQGNLQYQQNIMHEELQKISLNNLVPEIQTCNDMSYNELMKQICQMERKEVLKRDKLIVLAIKKFKEMDSYTLSEAEYLFWTRQLSRHDDEENELFLDKFIKSNVNCNAHQYALVNCLARNICNNGLTFFETFIQQKSFHHNYDDDIQKVQNILAYYKFYCKDDIFRTFISAIQEMLNENYFEACEHFGQIYRKDIHRFHDLCHDEFGVINIPSYFALALMYIEEYEQCKYILNVMIVKLENDEDIMILYKVLMYLCQQKQQENFNAKKFEYNPGIAFYDSIFSDLIKENFNLRNQLEAVPGSIVYEQAENEYNECLNNL